MGAERRRRTGALRGASALAALVLAAGCFKQQPAEERAPAPSEEVSAEPASAAPPIPTPPPGAPMPSATSVERRASPADDQGGADLNRSGAGRAAPSPPLAPQKPAAKARSGARTEVSAEADRPLGGALRAEPEPDPEAPARLRQRLDRAYRANTPDCPSARERKKAVCDLASQICQLIDRDPNVASVAEYCAEAKERCTAAERRTAERCAE